MAENKVVAVGSRVRDFSLRDQDGKQVQLSTLRGKKILLSWHPLAWTGICALQMQSLEKNRRAFAKLGAVALGLSVDTVPSKKAWAASLKIKETRLFRKDDGISQRANIILDETGKVIFVKVYPIKVLPPIEEILAVLKSLPKKK
jgi:peroxiredoxin